MNIAVFVSGTGSNLQALIDAEKKGELSTGRIELVVSNKPGVLALERAEKAGIEAVVIEPLSAETREEYDKRVDKELESRNIQLIVLAGFMRILSECFVKKYDGRMVNIHPSLLPSFKGVHGIKDAFDAGVKVTGVTVHFVINELDAGPVISQRSVCVEENDTLQSLEEKIHAVEHALYPEAVREYVNGDLKVEGNKVKRRS